MKNVLALFFLLTLGAPVLAQDTQTRSVSSFRGVKAAQGIDVYLKKGDKESVRVTVSGTRLDNVITEVSGSYLKIHMRDGNQRGRIDVKVYVTYTKIEKLSASSAASILSDGTITGDDLEISCSSAANIEVVVDVNRLEASASSAGEIELKGQVKSLLAEVSSAGEIDAYDLEAQQVEVEASSAGSAKVSVANSLQARASSGGSIRYRGNPSKSMTNSSSGGSVKKSN
jgi:phosphotransferase system HPr-like phosphotransfer protein